MVFFDFLGLGFLDLHLQQWQSLNVNYASARIRVSYIQQKVEQGIDFGILQVKRGTGCETRVAVQSESRARRTSFAEFSLISSVTIYSS